jgi:tetratricopeptide (TPR) repeat protein
MSDINNNTNTNNSNNPQNGAGRPLPKKEADLFKHLVKQYEMKQYKKAIKQADTILKKFPKHGETLAMKGLTYNYMSGHTREEAHALVKEGLKNDMRYGSILLCVCVCIRFCVIYVLVEFG